MRFCKIIHRFLSDSKMQLLLSIIWIKCFPVCNLINAKHPYLFTIFAIRRPAADLAATCLCWSPVLDNIETALATLMYWEAASRAALASLRMNLFVSDVLIINKLTVCKQKIDLKISHPVQVMVQPGRKNRLS